jgi:hypothetical protein
LSFAKSLRNSLKDKDEALYDRLMLIEPIARSVLTFTASKFPDFTPHDFGLHSLNVEKILNWMVPDEVKSSMDSYELFFLITSAWLHDWGMVASKNEDANEVRQNHHERTEKNFQKMYKEVLLSQQEANIAGRICRGHRTDDLQSGLYANTFIGSNNNLVRVSFLAALLRLADECDVKANRTPEIIYSSIQPEGRSEEEFRKHLSIGGIGPLTKYKLQLNGTAYTPKGVQVIEAVRKKIEEQLDLVKTILFPNGVMFDVISEHIDAQGFINMPIGFELDKNNIIELLVGKALYSRKDVAIRELLQNAIDTCRFKKILEPNYKPRIIIEFSDREISFDDNGIGMNFNDALDFFSRKGHSFFNSKEYKEILAKKTFDPISKFGIGFLSSFLISEGLVVESKRENCRACKFTICELWEGWTYEEGKRKENGTKITLVLNKTGKEIDLKKSLLHYAKQIDIPITVLNKGSGETFEFQNSWDYQMAEVPEAYSEAFKGITQTAKPIDILKGSTKNLDVTLYIFEQRSFSDNNCFVSKLGIYVCNRGFFSAPTGRWLAFVHSKTDAIDLSVSRDKIIENSKYVEFLKEFYSLFFDIIKNHKAEKDYDLETSITISQSFDYLFYHSFGISANENEAIWLNTFWEKNKNPVISVDGIQFLSGEEIISKHPSKIIHFSAVRKQLSEQISLLKDSFKQAISQGALIVFDISPQYSFITYAPSKFMCSFCYIAHERGFKEIDCLSLPDVVSKIDYQKQVTPLDHLLTNDSYFSALPEKLRGLVIERKPFVFDPLPEARSKYVEKENYHVLVLKSLFEDERDFSEVFYNELMTSAKNPKLVSPGTFIYDSEDPFLKFLIAKSEVILGEANIRKMVERYLKLLAARYLSVRTVEKVWSSDDIFPLLLLEKTIAEKLEFRNYVSLEKRAGVLTSIYDFYR